MLVGTIHWLEKEIKIREEAITLLSQEMEELRRQRVYHGDSYSSLAGGGKLSAAGGQVPPLVNQVRGY